MEILELRMTGNKKNEIQEIELTHIDIRPLTFILEHLNIVLLMVL